MTDSVEQKFCYRCGKYDHHTTDCSHVERLCFNCEQPGHERRDCPKPKGILKRTCGGCGEKGHWPTDCPTRFSWKCRNCEQLGHAHWECSKPRGYLKLTCRRCQEKGHLAHECTNASKWHCMNCNANGHLQYDCPKPRRSAKTCFECGEVGHTFYVCPKHICSSCGEVGHHEQRCRKPWADSQTFYWRRGSTDDNEEQCPTPKMKLPPKPEHPKVQKENPKEEPKPGREQTNAKPQTTKKPQEERKPDVQAMNMLRVAQAALQRDEYHTVITLLTNAIVLDPYIDDIYSTRGIAHAKSKKYISALSDFQHASTLEGYTPSAAVLVHTARCRLRLGSHSAALLAVREALSLTPDDRDALALKRRVLDLESHIEGYRGACKRKHWRVARASYEACLKAFAEESVDAPVEIQCWGVELLIAEGKWTTAMSTADLLMKSKGNAIEAKVLRALVLFLSGKLPAAFDQIVAVLKLDPDNASARELRTRIKEVRRLKDAGNAHFQDEEWSEAIEMYSSALQVVAEREEDCKGGLIRAILLLNRATARLKVRLFAEGLKDVNSALALDPSYFKAYRARARIHVGLELYESAVEDFKFALEHGASLLNSIDKQSLRSELEEAERDAERERKKEKDYYKILGLSRTSSVVEIKKAYRIQSLKHHPDKGGVAEMFKLVAEAYQTLSDPEKRRNYDARTSQYEDRSYSSYDDDDDDDDDDFNNTYYSENGWD